MDTYVVKVNIPNSKYCTNYKKVGNNSYEPFNKCQFCVEGVIGDWEGNRNATCALLNKGLYFSKELPLIKVVKDKQCPSLKGV